MHKSEYILACVPLLLAALVLPTPAIAQTQSGLRVYQEQLRVRLDEQRPATREVGFDAGGWFNFAFFNYDDSSGEKHRLRQYQLRGWASLNVRDVHKFYVRALVGYNDWNAGDNPKIYQNDGDIDPTIERAWYKLDLGRLLAGPAAPLPSMPMRLTVGREFMDIGTAFVLSQPLDLVKFEIEPGNLRLMGFLGKTFMDTNLDQSDPVATHQKRCFWGFQADYLGFDRHIPFAYFLANNDNGGPQPDDPGQDYDYTSRYVGVGSQGTIFLPNLRYRVEAVGEWGETYSNGVVSGQDDICAFGADAMLEYYFTETAMRPKLTAEWLFGSGDDDRLNSSTNTVGGNEPGTNDNAFNAFGFRDTGLAFAPSVSNLHIYIIGASLHPLENHKLFKDMEVGSKAFFYHKDKSGGPISDTSANTTEQWVGWEWDLYCDWRITSDLSVTVRYGAFQPGSAFEDQECRQFFFTALNYSF